MRSPIRPSAREAIIAAAFDVLGRDPSASLADVASRAGVGRATLHRQFASREELVHALALIAVEETDAAANAACDGAASHGEALRRTLAALIPIGDRHGFLTREPIEDDPAIAAELDRQIGDLNALIEGAKSEGVFDRSVPTSWIAQAFDHLLYAAWRSVAQGEATHAQAADLAWRTLANGLGKTRE